MSRVHNRALSAAELQSFGDELDAIRARVQRQVGAADARYIRRIVAAVRWSGVAGRALLFLGAFVHSVLIPAWIAGVVLLTLSKILENMELGHNVMHGQYDWMGDPQLNGNTYEWDIVATGDNWRKTHNFKHHTYTNVRGMDDDIGYGLLRIFPEQRWRPFYLLQPFIAVVFALLFEWGVAIQDLRLGRWFAGKIKAAELRAAFLPVGRKMGRQMLKDYIVFPLLAGPFFLTVLLGNLAANVLRSIWTFVIILRPLHRRCGSVPEGIDPQRIAWSLVSASAARVVEPHRRQVDERAVWQSEPPDRTPLLPGPASQPLCADRRRSEADLCALRPALQHRLAAAAVRSGDVADRAPRLPEPAQAGARAQQCLAERVIGLRNA